MYKERALVNDRGAVMLTYKPWAQL